MRLCVTQLEDRCTPSSTAPTSPNFSVAAELRQLYIDASAAIRTATRFPALSTIIRLTNDAATIARSGPITYAEQVTLATDTLAVLSSAHVGAAQYGTVANDLSLIKTPPPARP